MGVKDKVNVTSLENNYKKQKEIDTRRTSKRRKLLVRRLSVFFTLAIVITTLLISVLFSRDATLKAMHLEKKELQETLTKLEKEQLLLENEIVKLNDDEYIAKLARSEYFFSEKGEIIFNIPK